MTIKLESLKADLVAEENGQWIESVVYRGVSYLLRSPESDGYREKRNQLIRQLNTEFPGAVGPPDDVITARHRELFLDNIVAGWKGLDVDYTPEKSAEVLTDPEFKYLLRDIEASSLRVGRRNIVFLDDAVKNSAPPSGSLSKEKAKTKASSRG